MRLHSGANRLQQGGREDSLAISCGCKLGDVFDTVRQSHRNGLWAKRVDESQRRFQPGVVLVEDQVQTLEGAELVDDVRAGVRAHQSHGGISPAAEREEIEDPFDDNYCC